jgi:predicted DNA-binding transcriptional regulator YafY
VARGDQLARQWSILNALCAGRHSRRALAATHGVSLKTITRDIDALSYFPITEERDGIDVYYRCAASFRPPQVHFTGDEAAALVLGRTHALDALTDMPLRPHFESALDKVERLLGASARRQSTVWQTALHLPALTTAHIDSLTAAITGRRAVRLRYFTAVRQQMSERIVEPCCLQRHPYGVQLIAYCRTRAALINFNLNLIDALIVLPDPFDMTPHLDALPAFLETGFDGLYTHPVIDVHLRLQPPAAWWMRDRFFHASQTITTEPDGTVHIRFRAGGFDAIVARVLSLGPSCTVLAPVSLRSAVEQQAQAIAARSPKKDPPPP